jgi:hypothetical protein
MGSHAPFECIHICILFDAPAGEYTFVLTVTDKQGNSAEVSSTLQLRLFMLPTRDCCY